MFIATAVSVKNARTLGFRVSSVLLLSLIAAHYLNLFGMVFLESGYRFPIEAFLILSTSGLFILMSNSFIYRKLEASYPFSTKLRERVILQICGVAASSGLVCTLVYLFATTVFTEYHSFQSFTFFLIICFFLSCSEALLMILARIYYLQKAQQPGPQTINSPGAIQEPELFIKSKKDILRLSQDQVALIYSSQGVVVVMDSEATKYITQYTSLNEIREFLTATDFFRVSRQVTVNRNTIAHLENEANGRVRILLKSKFREFGRPIYTSRHKSKELWKWFAAEELHQAG
ncbi:LytTR family DNA-binding domain-containing protein [Poritiphilus flavus]|uniref:HTH LytTR-type domain-containing protein n=1 Tax=Poritiphilus flavus TaxID=2697053 RepID=A0A6L9EBK7_9FLAO|nr:LytTR family DNA-binding domain-containing protein [Poritiphilus flavus]NAS11951.1 hypothetical protein [Poritiphilus flavus]